MAKGFKPTLRTAFTGDIEVARAPSEDELEDMLHQLMEWQGQQGLTGGLPRDLYIRLRQLLEWLSLQQPWTAYRIKLVSWCCVREGRDRLGMSWEESYEHAMSMLEGTPAEAGPDMMKKRYDEMQRELPPAQRRPRTYRPRKREG
jgi:hypothetical protein